MGRAYAWRIYKRPHGDMGVSSILDDRIQERATLPTMHVFRSLVPVGHGVLCAVDYLDFFNRYARQRLERRPSRAPAIRAMAVHGIRKFVGDFIGDGPAPTLSREIFYHPGSVIFADDHNEKGWPDRSAILQS